MKRLVTIVASLVSMIVLSSAPLLAAAGEVSFWTQFATQPYVLEALAAFTEETGIKVNVRPLGYDTDTLFVAYVGDSSPDLFSHGGAALGAFASLGMLTPLEPHLARWDFAGDMIPEALVFGMYEGEQLALPFPGVAVRDLVYDARLFEESGLSADLPPADWDDLVSYGRKLVRIDDDDRLLRAAIHVELGTEQMFSMFHHQLGGELFTNGKPTLNSDASIEALTFLSDLVHQHRLADVGFVGNIVEGTSAMDWNTALLFSHPLADPDYLRVATFPYAKQPATFGAVDFIAIPNNAQNMDAALLLMEFLVHPDRQEKLVLGSGQLPFYAQAVEWDWVRTSPVLPHYMEAFSYARPNPAHERWFDIRGILRSAVDAATRQEDRVPAQVVLEQSQMRLERLLAE